MGRLLFMPLILISGVFIISCGKQDRNGKSDKDQVVAGRVSTDEGADKRRVEEDKPRVPSPVLTQTPEAPKPAQESESSDGKSQTEVRPKDAEISSLCKAAISAFTSRNWERMDIDVSQIFDVKTSKPLSVNEVIARGLRTTIRIVRPEVAFNFDDKKGLLNYTYAAGSDRKVNRAFAVLGVEGDSCILGIDESRPLQGLRDFGNGTVKIKVSAKASEQHTFEIEWVNPYFIQKGTLKLN